MVSSSMRRNEIPDLDLKFSICILGGPKFTGYEFVDSKVKFNWLLQRGGGYFVLDFVHILLGDS